LLSERERTQRAESQPPSAWRCVSRVLKRLSAN
jgi:hypothetical protein